MTKTTVIQYPDSLTRALDLSDEEIQAELSFMAAAKLYELGRVTASQAAELSGIDRLDFLQRLAATGVPAINLRGLEIDAEVEAAKDLARPAQSSTPVP